MEYLFRYTKQGNSKAHQMFERAIALDPKYAVAYAMLGLNYWLGWVLALDPDPNSLARGVKLEKQAIALDDSLGGAHSMLAALYMQTDQTDRAITEAERGVVLDPNSASGYLWLAEVLDELGKPTQALAAIDKGMRLDPRNADSYLSQQGFAYTQLGRLDAAISSLKQYTARHPGDIWSHDRLAADYAAIGDKDAAQAEIAEVERAVALESNSAIGYEALAEALNATGRPAEALAAVKKGAGLNPRERYFDGLRGWAYSQLGHWQEAISVLTRLPSSDGPWSSDFHAMLAVDYLELGRDGAARAEIAKTLKIDPRYSLKRGLWSFLADQERFAADLRKLGLK